MSRSTAVKATLAAAALVGAGLAAAPAHATATPTVTKVGPSKTALAVAAPVTIKGTNFDSTIAKVQFGSAAACASTTFVVTSSTSLVVTAPTDSSCTAGFKDVTLLDSSGASLASLTATADGKNTVKFVAPVVTSGASFTTSTGVAGSTIAVTGLTNLPLSGVAATLGGKPISGLKQVGTGGFTGKVPALAPGDYPVVVKADGVSSAASTAVYTVLSTIKVSPNIYLKSATAAPEIKITGLGFKPALTTGTNTTPTVTVCGVAATVSTDAKKAYTDSTLYATVPSFTAAAGGSSDGKVDATDGGACIVKVTVDVNGSVADVVADSSATPPVLAQVNAASVVTGSAGFVYAAY